MPLRKVQIVEVGPRDGLQNEKQLIPTDIKVAFINALSDTGLTQIEVSAFVSPKWIPQLADADDVFRHIKRKSGVTYSALVPNERGLERALAAGVNKIAVFSAASETFNQKNINTSIAGSILRFVPVVQNAHALKLPTRGYISTAFWCPYEGHIQPERTVTVAKHLLDLGIHEISIGDTIGKATPSEVRELLDQLLKVVEASKIAMHFHDTYGRALTNILTSWEMGIEIFDSSAGGLGGCPYAPGAPGNVATSLVIEALRKADGECPINIEKLAAAYDIVANVVTKK
jgi:hydroxymethylglutaryl-CoA lyase